jgi:hypothetical protein
VSKFSKNCLVCSIDRFQVAQRKRAGLITRRTLDRNQTMLIQSFSSSCHLLHTHPLYPFFGWVRGVKKISLRAVLNWWSPGKAGCGLHFSKAYSTTSYSVYLLILRKQVRSNYGVRDLRYLLTRPPPVCIPTTVTYSLWWIYVRMWVGEWECIKNAQTVNNYNLVLWTLHQLY